MQLKILAPTYYEWLKVQGLRPETQKGYRKYLEWMLKYFEQEEITTLDGFTEQALSAYQLHLYGAKTRIGEKRPLSVYHQKNTVNVMKSFSKFLVESGYLLRDVSAHLKYPRLPQRLPETLSTEDVEKILSAVDIRTTLGFRDRTILETLYSTAMRNSELCALEMTDVNLKDEEIHIKDGKGGKARMVPLGEIAAEYVREYLQTIRPKLMRMETPLLFLSDKGAPVTKNGLMFIARRCSKKAGIKFTPHSLRHACATHLLKNGADIRYIQALLGHSSLMTTQLYTKVDMTDLKTMHETYHPRETFDEL